jgi:hypothetical protein
MDFMKRIIEGLDDSGIDNEEANGRVFHEAMEVAEEIKRSLVAKSRKYSEADDYFRASLFMFTAVWALTGHVYGGVRHTNEKKGKGNMVAKLWHLMRVAFMSGSPEQALIKLRTFEEEFEEGKYED